MYYINDEHEMHESFNFIQEKADPYENTRVDVLISFNE